jgi:hypothetical protein
MKAISGTPVSSPARTGTWFIFREATAIRHYPDITNSKFGLFLFQSWSSLSFRIELREIYIDLFEGFIKGDIFNRKAAACETHCRLC